MCLNLFNIISNQTIKSFITNLYLVTCIHAQMQKTSSTSETVTIQKHINYFYTFNN